MVLQLPELIIIAAIILVAIFILPGKLPQLARSLGQAKREFEKASKRDELIERARELGIDVTGMTYEEIEAEVKRRGG
jgi:sec-independent protein translocase protein TatA